MLFRSVTLTLRCYAYGSDRNWEAICVDLDVASFGASLEEAKASLAACIELYVEGVEELPADEQRRLLARRSPWYVRAKLTWLTRRRGGDARPLRFTLRSHIPSYS